MFGPGVQAKVVRTFAAVRKLINFTHATLDGYIDNPHEWSLHYADEDLQDYLLEMMLDADALLLGRVTYEGMAQAWPTRVGDAFADHVNSITKYVVASQAVDTTAWDPTVVIAGPGLLDEYRICTSPVIKGGAEPLFRAASTGVVDLLDTRIVATGAVIHAYRPGSAS